MLWIEKGKNVDILHCRKIFKGKVDKIFNVIDPETKAMQARIKLKNPDDVYYKMYKDAKEKAKAAKNIAIEAYLAAEEIKLTYNLNNIDSSDSDDSDDSSNDNDNDNEWH